MSKLYVDSNRPAQYNYFDVKNWEEIRSKEAFKERIENAIDIKVKIDTISFDYDLADGTGIECLEYLVNKSIETGMPFPKIYIHSEKQGVYMKFENMCDVYTRNTQNQYVLESRRKY